MSRGAQLERLRQVRARKVDQAQAAVATARSAAFHWEGEAKRWSQAVDQIESIGQDVIKDVMEESAKLHNPHLMYEKIQGALQRHRNARQMAVRNCETAQQNLKIAQKTLKEASIAVAEASGREEAVAKVAKETLRAEQIAAEALAEDEILDDFAASLFMEARNEHS